MRTPQRWYAALTLLLGLAVAGCGGYGSSDPGGSNLPDARDENSTPNSANSSANSGEKAVEFKDDVESNVEPPAGLDGLVFLDTAGNRVALKDYLGEKNIVLVFTEGFAGMLCPFCKTRPHGSWPTTTSFKRWTPRF